MEKRNNEQIRLRLHEMRRTGRERYLEMLGVDVKSLRALERDIASEYEELAAALQDQRRQEGKDRADQQALRLKSIRGAFNADLESALHTDLSTQKAVIDHLAVADLDPAIVGSIWWCHCHYTNILTDNLGHDDTIAIDPPTGGSGTGSVNYDSAMNQARPYVSVSGQGTGTVNAVQVRTWLVFAFTPGIDGTYCIRPLVFMNGWWLLWTWGACGGTSEDLGTGDVKVVLRVRVDQLSSEVKRVEHEVLNQNSSGGADSEGAIYYDSEKDGGASMTVNLQGGHEAVIFVECEIHAQISNHGRAIMDMQNSPGFYFWVPEVRVGKRHCHWPFFILEREMVLRTTTPDFTTEVPIRPGRVPDVTTKVLGVKPVHG